MLAIRDLHVRLARRSIVRGVSLAVAPGEIVAMLGPNGSGKTTLLRAAMGFVKHSDGYVSWRGDHALVDDPARLARVAAYLPQSPTAAPSQRVVEAIALGRFAAGTSFVEGDVDRAAIARAATLTGVADLLDARVSEISGGQRQRVFLARCLAQQTPALVLDEPASFLDLRHQLDICRLLRRLSRDEDRAVLMTSHDVNLAAEFADRVAVMNNGVIVADGPPGDVLTPALIGDVFGVTVRRIDVDGRPRLVTM